MADKNPGIPLWLDIKTEYIDENFERVLQYLHTASMDVRKQDSFYQTTVNLLEKRVTAVLEDLYNRPIYAGFEDESLRTVHIRMLAVYLLAKGGNASLWDRAYIGILSLLQGAVPNCDEALTNLALNCLLKNARKELPFSWRDVLEFMPQVFAYKLCQSKIADTSNQSEVLYENKGTVLLQDNRLCLTSESGENLDKNPMVASVEALGGKIQVLTPKSEKVKQSDLDNLEKLETFTNHFIKKQRTFSSPKKKVYAPEASMEACVVRKTATDLYVRTVDPDYQVLEGPLSIEESFQYNSKYSKDDFLKYLNEGDLIEVQLIPMKKPCFSVGETFVNYIVTDRMEKGKQLGIVKEVKLDKKQKLKAHVWVEDGYPVYCPGKDSLRSGDFVEVNVTGSGKDNYYGYVNGVILGVVSDETFDEEESRKACIEQFVYETDVHLKDTSSRSKMHPGKLKELSRMLVSYQKTLSKPSERYRILCVARILSELNAQESDSKYIDFLSNYLENLVCFAKGDISKIKDLVPDASFQNIPAVMQRIQVTAILQAYADSSKNYLLAEMGLSTTNKFLQKLAILVQSCNQLNNVISGAMQNVIKREILKHLAIDMEGDTNLEEENGIYLGMENDQTEFKMSFMEAPQTAREQNQNKTIFNGVCAFLNSQNGGTLYIGVNDLGYVSGVEEDIKKIQKISRYHQGLDGFVRYITDKAKEYFPLNVLPHIKVQPMYDGKVMAIAVQPYPFNIVKVDGTAYIRINSETVELSEQYAKEIMANRILSDRENAYLLTALMEAINSRRKIIIHGYSSSHSGQIKDRHVEPFAFTNNQTAVWCYDLDKGENRTFKVERMGNVEILDQEWTCMSKHKQSKVDIFGMTGTTPIKISLQLNLLAKNLLVEEYPAAENFIISTPDTNRWILNTEVCQIEGIGRFYMGLANCIEILDAPELKAYVKEFVKVHF